MPGAIEGTYMFDWYGENIKGYSVVQPGEIVAEGEEPGEEPTEEPVPTETSADSHTDSDRRACTFRASRFLCNMELDKTKVKVGDIITATIKIENMKNFAGYQLNIKYDPTMLEAIELETGSAIAKRTWPVTGGTVLQSDNYGKTTAVANDVGAGIINFAEAYSNLTKYRETGVAEETGIIGKIGFRVLKAGSTAIRFEDTTAMPGAIEGHTCSTGMARTSKGIA